MESSEELTLCEGSVAVKSKHYWKTRYAVLKRKGLRYAHDKEAAEGAGPAKDYPLEGACSARYGVRTNQNPYIQILNHKGKTLRIGFLAGEQERL